MKMFRVFLVAVAVAGSAVALHGQPANSILAVVHDSVITRQEVDRSLVDIELELRRQYRSQPQVYYQKLADARNESLEQMLERKLILHEFHSAGYVLPESVIDEFVKERLQSVAGGDRVTMTKTLQAQGLTYEKWKQRLRDEFIVSQMRLKNIQSEIIISPYKIETYYLAHQEDYKLAEQVKLRMITVNKPAGTDAEQSRKLAEEIVAKIKDGAAFTEMAAVYSQGRTPGGDWGWIERKVLRPELADVAFSLKAGEMSGVIETPEAFYVLLVEDKRTSHVRPLSEVRDEIERTMLTAERARLQKQWIDRLRKKTFVRYF
jgi:peptidyl-prolyl cis-trans isomerase SurA